MGNCNSDEPDRRRVRLSLENETFIEASADFSSALEPEMLTDLLLTKLKPEFKKRSVAFVPSINHKLVDSIRRGQHVSIGVMVKDSRKLRVKCLSACKLETKLIFADSSSTIGQVLELLGIPQSAEVVYEKVCLPNEVTIDRLPKTVPTLTVFAEGRASWQCSSESQDFAIWKLTGPGVNFEGECRNSNCNAYCQIVFMHKGLGAFLLQDESLKVHPCPICNSATQLHYFGVSFCNYELRNSSLQDSLAGRVETEYLRLYKFEDLGTAEVVMETSEV